MAEVAGTASLGVRGAWTVVYGLRAKRAARQPQPAEHKPPLSLWCHVMVADAASSLIVGERRGAPAGRLEDQPEHHT